jgi:PAS domain-containing protein
MVDELLDAAPEAILVVDGAGTVRKANARAEELFAYTQGALVGRSRGRRGSVVSRPEWRRGPEDRGPSGA